MDHTVVFRMKYERTNDESQDRDPTPEELENYVASSRSIPENPVYMDELVLTSAVTYRGDLTFSFTCQTVLSPTEIANLFLQQSLSDGEWGAPPGYGSFVYPCRDMEQDEELGLLSFEYVLVDGNKF